MDPIFKSLADPSRRHLLDALRKADGQSLSELEGTLSLSRFGVAKHLKVLEGAGLVSRIKRGRFTHHHLNADALTEALNRWLAPFAAIQAADVPIAPEAHLDGREESPDMTLHCFIRCPRDALWSALRDRARRPFRPGPACTVISSEPGIRLVTQMPAHGGLSITRIAFEITAEEAHQHLLITHSGLTPPVRPQIAEAWARWSAALKTWLETGKPTFFQPPPDTTQLSRRPPSRTARDRN